jgi:hypothetical protein
MADMDIVIGARDMNVNVRDIRIQVAYVHIEVGYVRIHTPDVHTGGVHVADTVERPADHGEEQQAAPEHRREDIEAKHGVSPRLVLGAGVISNEQIAGTR